uniref:MIF4G domain-containing protein n=1 Tax=Angiostrongylus cantonensis TaxID=6313 RepID=A0A0K0D5J7_ANGCA
MMVPLLLEELQQVGKFHHKKQVFVGNAILQRSSGSGSGHGVGVTVPKETLAPFIGERRTKQNTPPKKELKKKAMTEREMADAAAGLRALRIGTISTEIEAWITSAFTADDLAETIGSALCQHAIEGGGGRPVAKICGVLRDSPSAFALYRGLLSSVSQYFECRDRLRADHFRMWISFLAFVADLYANVGGGKDGELVNFVFQVFDYLLRAPILETLKIEELESLISALLSVGYDLERECPDQLSLLKDLIRDAFIDVSEPWARKMILLLLELGASGWKLPAEANEYYFQQTTN